MQLARVPQPLLDALFGAMRVVIGLCLLKLMPLTVTGRVGFGLHGVGFVVLACGLREMDAFWRWSVRAFSCSTRKALALGQSQPRAALAVRCNFVALRRVDANGMTQV